MIFLDEKIVQNVKICLPTEEVKIIICIMCTVLASKPGWSLACWMYGGKKTGEPGVYKKKNF